MPLKPSDEEAIVFLAVLVLLITVLWGATGYINRVDVREKTVEQRLEILERAIGINQ